MDVIGSTLIWLIRCFPSLNQSQKEEMYKVLLSGQGERKETTGENLKDWLD